LEESYANLTVLETDIRIEGEYEFWKGCHDKQRKVLFGLLYCQELNPDTFMIVDADDLVHRDLVRFVSDHSDVNAFILNRGYRYNFGNIELRKSRNFHMISASSMVFPYVVSEFKDVRSADEVDAHYATQTAHPKPIEKIFDERKIKYRYIPYYAGVYMRGYDDSLRDDALASPEIQVPDNGNPSKNYLNAKWMRGILWKIYGRLLGTQLIDDDVKKNFAGILVK
jgi:hypothetical protein